MKIEIEIPDKFTNKIDSKTIKEMKSCAYIPLVEKDLIGTGGISNLVDYDRQDIIELFCKINYGGWKISKEEELEKDDEEYAIECSTETLVAQHK